MTIKTVTLGLTLALATLTGSARAESPFSALEGIPAQAMNEAEMEAVQGKCSSMMFNPNCFGLSSAPNSWGFGGGFAPSSYVPSNFGGLYQFGSLAPSDFGRYGVWYNNQNAGTLFQDWRMQDPYGPIRYRQMFGGTSAVPMLFGNGPTQGPLAMQTANQFFRTGSLTGTRVGSFIGATGACSFAGISLC